MSDRRTGFAVIYRWRVAGDQEDSFIAAWARLTELIRNHPGGRGSRLHRGDDGLFYAYAQWPARAAWAEADGSLLPDVAKALSEQIQDAILERLDPIPLTPVGDLLVPEVAPD